MKPLTVTPRTEIAAKLLKLRPGSRLVFKKGDYTDPIFLNGIRGTYREPIIIEAERGARFTSGFNLYGEKIVKTCAEGTSYRERANKIAKLRQEAGYYPSIGQTGAEAAITLYNCQFIILKGLRFENCWPTSLMIDECQNIAMHNLDFEDGSIAIGAGGRTTRDLLIDHCTWVQDKSARDGEKIWKDIPWSAIHGADNNQEAGRVSVENDYRAYDGDFFRAWDIAGNVTIRHCDISDAFNGIHFFNNSDELPPGVQSDQLQFNSGRRVSANVLIEHNTFTRIRDNVIEPEDFAWNWVVRHNTFDNCYRAISLELKRMAWLYFYGNKGWILKRPGNDNNKGNRSSTVFKLNKAQQAEGKVYVFNNSWVIRKNERVFPKRALGGLRHFNNAYHCNSSELARFFGDLGVPVPAKITDSTTEITAEERRFTRRWDEFGIEINGDITNDDHFPTGYRALGYALGPDSKNAEPGFTDPKSSPPDLKLVSGASAKGAAIGWQMMLPSIETANDKFPYIIDMESEIVAGSGRKTVPVNVGAAQDQQVYAKWDKLFSFLPDYPMEEAVYRHECQSAKTS